MDQATGRADDEKIDIGLRDSNGVGFAYIAAPSYNIQKLTMTDPSTSEDRKPVIADELGHDGVGFKQAESEPPNTPIINREQQSAPLVSVIVRSVGRKELKEALDSIALQDYPNIEVVVVDALGMGCPMLGRWCGSFPLRTCSTGQPLSRSRAANLGLESAAGEWLIFLDEDDLFSSEHISKLVDSVINNEGVLAAYSGIRVVDNNNSTIKIFDEPFDLARLRGANFIPIHAVLFNRALVRADTRFDESLEIFEDWDFWLQLTERTRFLRVPGVSAVYRHHLGQSGLSKNSQHEKYLASRALLFSKWNHRYSPQEWVETLYWFEGEREQQLLRVSELEKGISVFQFREAALESRIAEFQSREAILESRVAERDAEARRYRESLEAILSSTFWKCTTPIRWLRHPIRALLSKDRFAIQLAHLKVTMGKAYLYYRKIGLKATARRIIVELRSLHTKARGPSLCSSELLNIHDIHPMLGDISSRIAVHAHVYYPDVIPEIASYLSNIPFAFDLFVSVSTDEVRDICHQAFARLPQARRVIVEVVENRGRDIAPMVCQFGDRLAQYDYICHLHTKKSMYAQGNMDGWLEYLLRQLMGSEDQVRRIFSVFQRDPTVGMIYPQNYEHLPYWGNTWLANRALGMRMCRQMGITNAPEGYFDYPAGSMFWARGKAMQDLFSAGIRLTDFPQETGQTDGSLAHCVERLLALAAKHAGYTSCILADPASPSWSTWRFDRYMARTRGEVKALLEGKDVKVVAFDIFDTLLIRPLLHPETVKTMIGHCNRDIGGEFARLRAQAEASARSRAGRDVGLEEIYTEFASLTGKSLDEVRPLCATEEHMELHLVSPRPDCIELFNCARASGKRVVLASDMFLPRRMVEKMLSENGITGYHALYLSSDIGVRKDTGELYRLLLEREQIAPGELLMVGDNEHSDVQIPLNMGIQVCHVLRPIEAARALPRFSRMVDWARAKGSLSEQLVLGLVINKLFRPVFYRSFDPASVIQGGPEDIGYAVVGPVVLSFCLWLMDTARKDGIGKLYFLAREGQLLKAVYDRAATYAEDAVPSEYLVLSRRAVTVPMIASIDDIFRIAADHEYFPNKLKKFLKYRYGLVLENDDLNKLYKKGFWKEAKSVEVKGDIRQLKPVLEELAEKIVARSRIERPGLTAYLDMIGLKDVASAAVVDVGYSATIQERLARFLGKPIQGYYMLTSAQSRENCSKHNIFARGYYGHQINWNEPDVSSLWRRSFELETLLSSDDPQAICYLLDKHGEPKAVYQETDDAQQPSNIRAGIRSGTIAFIDDFFSLRNRVYPDLTLSTTLPEMLFGEFIEHMSDSERTMLPGLVLDDHYCGRGMGVNPKIS